MIRFTLVLAVIAIFVYQKLVNWSRIKSGSLSVKVRFIERSRFRWLSSRVGTNCWRFGNVAKLQGTDFLKLFYSFINLFINFYFALKSSVYLHLQFLHLIVLFKCRAAFHCKSTICRRLTRRSWWIVHVPDSQVRPLAKLNITIFVIIHMLQFYFNQPHILYLYFEY